MENEDLRDTLPAIADDFLIQVADQAERRVDAVMKIKRIALKVTNARDWTDQQGNPYLQVSGSEKIANLFNISWRIDEPLYEEEPNGHFTWTYKGYFTLGGRSIEAIGTRSSKDAFFNKYEYLKIEGQKDERKLLPPSAIDKGDVKKAALTNLFGNGITRILGIRNLTWNDLKEFAEITQDQVTAIQYRKSGEKPPIAMPQEKKTEGTEEVSTHPSVTIAVDKVTETSGKKKDNTSWILYILHSGENRFNTFSKTFADIAKQSIADKVNVILAYSETPKGKKIEGIVMEQAPEPGSEEQ